MAYWLLKSEPTEYSIQDLKRDGVALWDGVRNPQARNFLLRMEVGDLCFFYHSSTEPPGVVGLCRVRRNRLLDPSQFDPQSPYFDPRSRPDAPRWWTVEVEYLEDFPLIPLSRLRRIFPPDHPLVRKGNRLSVLPVPEEVAEELLRIATGRKGSR